MAETQKLSEQEKAQAKEKLAGVDRRFKSDPAFAAKMKADPVATLKAEGIPNGLIQSMQYHAAKKRGDDVSGYYMDYNWDNDSYFNYSGDTGYFD